MVNGPEPFRLAANSLYTPAAGQASVRQTSQPSLRYMVAPSRKERPASPGGSRRLLAFAAFDSDGTIHRGVQLLAGAVCPADLQSHGFLAIAKAEVQGEIV